MEKLFFQSIFLFCICCTNCSAQNIWEPTNGPNGVNIIDFIVERDSLLVLSGIDVGILMSNDKGKHWTKYYMGLPDSSAAANSLAEGPDGFIYAIVNSQLYKLNIGSKIWENTSHSFSIAQLLYSKSNYLYILDNHNTEIYFSNDNGLTIHRILDEKKFKKITAYSFNGYGNNYFIVDSGQSYSIYRMNDDGSEPHEILNTPNFIFGLNWHPNGYVYFYEPDALYFYKMDSSGNQFVKIQIDTGYLSNWITKITNKPNGNLLALTEKGDYESSDNGLNWVKKNSLYAVPYNIEKLFFIDSSIFIFLSRCSQMQLLRSDDNGLKWLALDSSFMHPLVFKIFNDGLGNIFARICSSNYLYTKDKGVQWENLNIPVLDLPVYDLVSTVTGNVIFLSYSSFKLYKSKNYGQSWEHFSIYNDSIFAAIGSDFKNMVIAFGDRSYISNDGGENWDSIPNPPSPKYLMKTYFHPDGTVFFVSSDFSNFIYTTDKYGLNQTYTPYQFNSIKSLCITDKGLIYIVGEPKFGFQSGLFVSNNKLEDLTFISNTYLDNIVVDSSGNLYGNNMYNKCVRSTDGGFTWEDFSSGLPFEDSNSFVVDDDQNIFIGLFYDRVFKTIVPTANPVSTKDYKAIDSVLINSNPVEHFLCLTISNKNIASGHYKIIDLNGIEKLSGEFHTNQFTVDCSSLPNGMAYIQVFEAGKFFCSEKFVVVH
jgi:hypothetical protein